MAVLLVRPVYGKGEELVLAVGTDEVTRSSKLVCVPSVDCEKVFNHVFSSLRHCFLHTDDGSIN